MMTKILLPYQILKEGLAFKDGSGLVVSNEMLDPKSQGLLTYGYYGAALKAYTPQETRANL